MKIELANPHDMVLAACGGISPTDVRRTEIDGVIDTGATRLVLPESIVKELGLPIVGETKVKYADQRRGTRSLTRYVWLKMLDREGVFSAIVEPARTDALVGAIVMEELDMLVDCVTGTCHPRDPHQILSEIE